MPGTEGDTEELKINKIRLSGASASERDDVQIRRWMNLEPIIQGEVSQKEKNKYHILMHIYEL